MAVPDTRNIVIVGGGIIGCTTAYFLTRHPSFNPQRHTITLLESTKIAGGASGKAGGLLALWAYPAEIVPLSYRLHKELADKHGGAERWGYRAVHCAEVSCRGRPLRAKGSVKGKDNDMDDSHGTALNGERDPAAHVSLQKRTKEALRKLRAAGVPDDLDWVAAEAMEGYDEMGDPSTTAQVHPFLFTTSMAQLAAEAGADIRVGARVDEIHYGADGKQVDGVTYTDRSTQQQTRLPATDVIVAAGPWTSKVLPAAPISALRAHSVTIRPTRPVSAYALFTQIKLPSGIVTPEIYARQTEVYACGEGDTLVPLPDDSSAVVVDEARCQAVVEHVASVSDELRDGAVTARQACYLPTVDAGQGRHPLVGPVGAAGLWLCAGHSCWGIQNGPGSAMVMSEFVFDGRVASADVTRLDPRRVL